MINRRYKKAIQEWTEADKRLLSAEKKIGAAFLDLLHQKESAEGQKPPQPGVSVTPSKEPKKKR
jgi:hypothetical protein